MMNKKGAEITAFVIFGIVLLIGVISGLLFYNSQINSSIDQSVFEKESVPLQIEPLQKMIDSCIERLAVESLIKAGQHGGYILENDLNNLKASRRYLTREMANSVYLSLDDVESKIPYWLIIDCGNYDPENNNVNCNINTNTIPSIDKIKNDIALYIDDEKIGDGVNKKTRLDDCLSNFGNYSIFYDISAKYPTASKVDFTDDELIITTFFEVNVKNKNTDDQYVLNYFIQKVPTRFKQMYESGVRLTNEQMKRRLIENAVLEYIDIYSDLNTKSLPPKYTVDKLRDNPITWSVQSVKTMFSQNIINSPFFINNLKVIGSNNYIDPREEYNLNSLTYETEIAIAERLQFFNNTANGMKFDYKFFHNPEWPIYLKINGLETGRITPDIGRGGMISPLIAWLNIHQYNNLYSFEAPIILTITDPNADERLFDNRYNLNLAWQTKIANNQLVNITNNVLGSYRSFDVEDSLFIDPAMWNKNVVLKVSDFYSKKPVSNMTITAESGIIVNVGESNSSGIVLLDGVKEGFPYGINTKVSGIHNDGNYVLLDDYYYNITNELNSLVSFDIFVHELKKPKLPIIVEKQYVKKDVFKYCYNDYCTQKEISENNPICELKDSNILRYQNHGLNNKYLKKGINNNDLCVYNFTITYLDNRKVNVSLISIPNEVPYYSVSSQIPTIKSSVYGVYYYNGNISENPFTYFQIFEDENIPGVLTTNGLIAGKYKLTLAYSENDFSDLGITPDITEDKLKEIIDNNPNLNNLISSFYELDFYVSEYQYKKLNDLKLKINIPVINFSNIDASNYDEYSKMLDYSFNVTKLSELNNQDSILNLPSGIFPSKPVNQLKLPLIELTE